MLHTKRFFFFFTKDYQIKAKMHSTVMNKDFQGTVGVNHAYCVKVTIPMQC